MFLSSSEISSRLVSDLRLGLPIILYDANTYFLTAAIETLYSEKLNKIKQKYQNVTIKNFDISKHSSIEKFIEECNENFQNKIDILINNAGITSDNLSIRMKDEEWNKVINLNLTSSFLLSKFFLILFHLL